MKKIFKRKSVAVPEETTPDITGLMNEIQKQLVSLNEKVDTLINWPQEAPAERHSGARHFPRANRSFERSSGFGRGRPDEGFKERSFTKVICAECGKECEVPFKPSADRPVYCRECFAKRKDGGSFKGAGSFRGKREESFSKEDRGFHHKKKASFRRRK